MQVAQRVVRGRGHDREGPPDGLRGRVAPARPQPGQGERPAVAPHDAVRLADRALALPLVERIDRHEAALAHERVAEGRAAGERLGPRVEHPRADLGLLGPVRDEPPAVGGDGAPLLALDDDDGLVGRGDVEPPPGIVDERLGPEDLGQLGRRTLLGEPSAHRPKSSEPSRTGRRAIARPPAPAAPVQSGRDDTGAPDGQPDPPHRSADARPRARLPRPRQRAARVGRLRRGRRLLLAGRRLRRPGDHRGRAARPGRGALPARTTSRRAVQSGRRSSSSPETPSTYSAWRNIAAARVRDGDLTGAIAAYREADRRAPARGQGRDRQPPRLAHQGDRRRARRGPLLRPGSRRRAARHGHARCSSP